MSRIKEFRKNAKMTQSELANAMCVDQTAVSKWELKKAFPDMETAIKLADFFGTTVDYLLERTDKKEKPAIDEEGELNAYLEELKNRDELRMLFSITKKATKADVEKLVKMIEAYLKD